MNSKRRLKNNIRNRCFRHTLRKDQQNTVNTYKSTDKFLKDYNYLSEARNAKLDRYLKNLHRLEQTEREIKLVETEMERDMKRINIDDCDEYYCGFCGKLSKDSKK